MNTNDDEEDYFPKYQLSTTDYEENDETEDPIDLAKPLPSDTEKVEKYTPSPIATVPIVATKAPYFLSVKGPANLLPISVPRKPSRIYAVTVVATRAQVDIATIKPIERVIKPFQPVTTTVFPSAKVPASLS